MMIPMQRRKRLGIILVVIFLFAAVLSAQIKAKRAPTGLPRPKLIVLLVVDQMRADYVDRFAPEWHGGLRRLIDQGAWFTNAAYPYAKTVTCAGHATISTGDFPSTHGMIENSWWDREAGKMVSCTADPRSAPLEYANSTAPNQAAASGATAQTGSAAMLGDTPSSGDSDARAQAPSFAEQLRAQVDGSRVVTMSLKARAAISLAGHRGDSVTWTDGKHWITSTAFQRSADVAAFVAAHPVEADLGKTASFTAPAPPNGSPHTFSFKLGNPGGKIDPHFYMQWAASPFSDAYLEKMAEAEVDSMKLGQSEATDFLGISFSALDIVGHAHGPDSDDVHLILNSLDTTLDALFQHLDRTVGREGYVVAFTSDHGVAPIPEQAVRNGLDAGRADEAELRSNVEKALEPFALGAHPVAAFTGSDLYFVSGVYAKLAANPKAMDATLAAIRGVKGVAEVFRGEQLNELAAQNPLAKAAAASYFPGRSGDLVIITKPYWFFDHRSAAGKWGEGTTHGAPYPYDQRVPVFLLGAGIAPGKFAADVTPADIAPTLAALAGITLVHTDGHALSAAVSAPESR